MNQKSDEHAPIPNANLPESGFSPTGTLTRREFLRLAAITSAGLVLAACAPAATPAPSGTPAPTAPAVAKTTALNMLQWSHFAPQGDVYFDKWAGDWGKKNNVDVKVEHINANDLAARLAGHVQNQAGPDIIQYYFTWPALYPNALMDVTDVADKLGKQLGGWYKDVERYCKQGEVWKAVPFSMYGNVFNYRGDWFKENNLTAPTSLKSLADFIQLAKDMNRVKHPFGESLGHSFTDPRVFWYYWLWSWGGKEVQEDGKTVAIDSPETLEAVNRAIELFNVMVPGTLSWDDNSNNRAFLAGQIGGTMNAASIYLTAITQGQERLDQKKQNPAIAVPADIEHALFPGGPGGKHTLQQVISNGIMSYSKNVSAAKDFVAAMLQPEVYTDYLFTVNGYNVGPLHAYDDAPIWKKDPKILPFRDQIFENSNKWPGWPSPPSQAGQQVLENFIVIDLFAKACSGEFTPKESITNTVTQLKRFYK